MAQPSKSRIFTQEESGSQKGETSLTKIIEVVDNGEEGNQRGECLYIYFVMGGVSWLKIL